MEVTDEMLMALADDELDPATAAALRARVAADPALQQRLAVFADSAALLRAALDPGPVPQRLIDAVMAAPVDQAADRSGGNVTPLPRRAPALRPVALAATVAALAFGLGGYLLGQAGAPGMPDPAAYATLATGAEQALPDGSVLRMLGSYDTDLGLCRMLSVDSAALSERRILCQDGADWRTALRVETPGTASFLPASDALSGAVDLWLDTVGAGPALAPEDEAAALNGG